MSHDRASLALLGCVVLWCLGLQVANLPFSTEVRHHDEVAYLHGGLLSWEGEPPAIRHAPGAPIVWAGWTYAAATTGMRLLARDPAAPAASWMMLPLAAADEALFDAYRDLRPLRALILAGNILLLVAAVVAGYRIGLAEAGPAGALLAGGTIASLPLFIEHAAQARPYLIGWCLSILALWRLVCSGSRSKDTQSAVLFGLAVASRIDLVVFGPLLLWRRALGEGRAEGAWRPVRFLAVAGVTTALASPWLVTGLLESLRTIVTVRVLGLRHNVWFQDLLDFAWLQGLAPLTLLVAAGLVVGARRERASRVALVILVVVLGMLVRGTDYGLRYHGASILTLIGLAPHALAALARGNGRVRSGRVQWGIAAVCLVLPMTQAVRAVARATAHSYADGSTEWIERHVPAGTTVYTWHSLHVPLPTAESAERLWWEAAGPDAWRSKLGEGLARFGAALDDPPRILSEEHLTLERGYRRRWFILGGEAWRPDPRYRVRLYSPVASLDLRLAEVIERLRTAGGVLVWKGRPVPELGAPEAAWTARDGSGTFIYRRPEAPG